MKDENKNIPIPKRLQKFYCSRTIWKIPLEEVFEHKKKYIQENTMEYRKNGKMYVIKF